MRWKSNVNCTSHSFKEHVIICVLRNQVSITIRYLSIVKCCITVRLHVKAYLYT